MAFQDNSGDIIFDVVLTDEGRRDLRVEMDLLTLQNSLWEMMRSIMRFMMLQHQHANQDLEILQTPVFEAFTNNTSVMSSMLMSIPRNNLFYLPMIKPNEVADGTKTQFHANNVMYVAVDANTENNNDLFPERQQIAYDSAGLLRTGIMLGFSTQKNSNYIRVDSGIDNSAVPPATNIADLFLDETQYSY
jgi:hypothetical protein